METNSRADEFPIHKARKLIMHLARPNPTVYWFDYLLSVSVGWAAFVFVLVPEVPTALRLVLGIISAFTLYRSTIFIHELTHLKRGTFKAFRIVWNLLSGFPMMLPSFVYKGVHTEHHVKSIYGTSEDGEYWPFIHTKRFQIVGFPAISLILPFYFAFRFIVLTPVILVSRRLRAFTWSWISSLAIIAKYRRPLPDTPKERANWVMQEWCAGLYGAAVIVLVLLQVIPAATLALWYGISAFAFFLNAFRTLVAHSYRNKGDRPMSESEQLLDSANVTSRLAGLWAPVGLRYHATHHLFMLMPYHQLGKAHKTLMRELPPDSLYHETLRSSLIGALGRLWREAGAAKQA
ncbi:MAG: fatty acid desaturase [Spirochaetales bacterium]|jgi:fatty acid desaturase|nr:fatty acid desaturase [Spirochaetales bacterium]